MRERTPALLLLIAMGGCTPDLEGTWVGVCETPDNDVRARVEIREALTPAEGADADDPLVGFAVLHLASVPDDYLYLECATVDPVLHSLELDGCWGHWNSEVEVWEPQSFYALGSVRREHPSFFWSGECFFDGQEGDFEMVKTP